MRHFLLARPWLFLVISFVIVGSMSAGIPRLVKDPSTDALIPLGDVANESRKAINETFGLRDPIIVGVSTSDGSSLLTESGLRALIELHDLVKVEPNIRSDRVKSLVSEISVSGTGEEVTADNFIGRFDEFDGQVVSQVRARIEQTPIAKNMLLSADESTALIIAEVSNPKLSDSTYEALQAKVSTLKYPGLEIHVAGQGAVSGYFNRYLDLDSKRMLPIALAVMATVLLLTFVSFKSAIAPLVLVAGTAGSTVGLMAWSEVPYFVITSSLPALLIAIAVADSIHLLSIYFDNRITNPEESHSESMLKALADQMVPITLTSLTTAIGFVVLAYFSSMPPMIYYGVFAAVGVLIAWILTFTLLPQLTVLIRLEPSKKYKQLKLNKSDWVGRSMGAVTGFALRKPKLIIANILVFTALGVFFTLQVKFDRTQVENFRPETSIRQADTLFNSKLAGTSFLDVMVHVKDEEGMLTLAGMNKIADLQRFMNGLPGVQKTQSILDYMDALDRAFNPGQRVEANSFPRLPSTDDAVAQYVLFLESSADPTALRDKIDSRYQTVLVRAVFNDSSYQGTKPAVLALREYVKNNFDGTEYTGTVGGRLNVDHSWMSTLENEHVVGVAASVFAIFIFCLLLFRSFFLSAVATAPVLFSILMIYGVMGLVGTTIEPATSMFASISLGLGIDFGIHFVHRLNKLWNGRNSFQAAELAQEVQGTARACFFNAAALGFGFSVMLFSQLPTLNRFGGLIAVAALSSFVAAMLITPSLFKTLRLRFS